MPFILPTRRSQGGAAAVRAEIEALRREGVGPRAIAQRLHLTHGQVAGHLHRAGLCIPSKPPVPKVAVLEFPPTGCCQFISGSCLAEFVFCGAPVERETEVWCGPHRKRVYVLPKEVV